MNIAGYEMNFGGLNMVGTIQTMSLWGIVGIVLVSIGIWWFITMRDKSIYKYPITLRVRRENGTKVRYDILGGVVQGRGGVKTFKCKIPRKFKKFDLGYMPDFSLADSSDRLSFIQEGDSTLWQQCKEELITEELIKIHDGKEEKFVKYSNLIKPIPTDTKTTTYNNLQSTRDLLDAKKMTAWGISILAFVIMVVAHLISLFIQTKIKCSTP